MNREAHAEQDDRQQREHDEKKHVQTSLLVSTTTKKVPDPLRVNQGARGGALNGIASDASARGDKDDPSQREDDSELLRAMHPLV